MHSGINAASSASVDSGHPATSEETPARFCSLPSCYGQAISSTTRFVSSRHSQPRSSPLPCHWCGFLRSAVSPKSWWRKCQSIHLPFHLRRDPRCSPRACSGPLSGHIPASLPAIRQPTVTASHPSIGQRVYFPSCWHWNSATSPVFCGRRWTRSKLLRVPFQPSSCPVIQWFLGAFDHKEHTSQGSRPCSHLFLAASDCRYRSGSDSEWSSFESPVNGSQWFGPTLDVRYAGRPPSHCPTEPVGGSLQLEDPDFLPSDQTQLYRLAQRCALLAQHFWCRWRNDYLISLHEFHRATGTANSYIQDGALILVHSHSPRVLWPLAIVTRRMVSVDGIVRAVELRFASRHETTRPVSKLYPLEVVAFTPAPPPTLKTPKPDSVTPEQWPRHAAAANAEAITHCLLSDWLWPSSSFFVFLLTRTFFVLFVFFSLAPSISFARGVSRRCCVATLNSSVSPWHKMPRMHSNTSLSSLLVFSCLPLDSYTLFRCDATLDRLLL